MALISWRLLEAGYCSHPELMVMRGGRWRIAQFPALVAVIDHPTQGRILFDTGYSEHFLSATRGFPERLYRAVTPVHLDAAASVRSQLHAMSATQSVRHVILSHFHGDHIGGLHDFAGAMIHCSDHGWRDITSRSRIDALRHGLLPSLLPPDFAARASFFEHNRCMALPSQLAPFEQGFDIFGDGTIAAVELPGHANGHFGIVFADAQGNEVFLIGDAAWSSAAIESNAPPPALVSGLLGDTRTYRNTLTMLHELHRRSPQLQIVPSHCEHWRSVAASVGAATSSDRLVHAC